MKVAWNWAGKLLAEELAVAAVGPGIVVCGEVGAGLDGGVAVLPELDEGAGIGVFKPGFAEMVEGGDGGLLRVGDDAVNGFLPVDVGLMLEVAAEGVADRLQHEAGDGDGEQQHDEAGAGGERSCSSMPAELPARAEAAGEPGGESGAGPVDEEQREGIAGNQFGNVVEDVVAALVAEDEEDFVVGDAAGGGVPHDDALGGADAADVGIEAVGIWRWPS